MSSHPDQFILLQSLFPDTSSAIISKALDAAGGDIELAADSLVNCDFANLASNSPLPNPSKYSMAKSQQTKKSIQASHGHKIGWKAQQNLPHRVKYQAAFSTSNHHSSLQVESPYSIPTNSASNIYSNEKTNDIHTSESEVTHKEPDENDEDDLYSVERKEANRVRKARDKAKRKAQAAYMKGDDATARIHQQQATLLGTELDSLQIEAGNRIFAKNNTISDPSDIEQLINVDLHGLHAEEAVKFANDRIVKLQEICDSKASAEEYWLKIVTGKGSHQTANPVLGPAIQNFLETNGFRFEKHTTGSFHVLISRKPAS